MGKNKEIILLKNIQGKIYTFRGVQVMLDSDLAEIYGVENKRLNEQVKRNIERFPVRFRFQLTSEEKVELAENYDRFNNSKKGHLTLKSQIAISSSSRHGGRRTLPYVFTEQGLTMFSVSLRKLKKRDKELKVYLGTNYPQVSIHTLMGKKRNTLLGKKL